MPRPKEVNDVNFWFVTTSDELVPAPTVTVGAGTSYSDVLTNQKFTSLTSLGIGTSLSGNTVEIWTR